MTLPVPAARRRGLLLPMLALLASAALAPLHAADRFDGVRAQIRADIAAGKTPSVAVAVVVDGQLLWEEGFGLADRARGIAATPHTPYLLASVSKPILTTALMRLAQDGRVDLDAPANRYLPDSPLTAHEGRVDDASVRRVANHSSGLPVHYRMLPGQPMPIGTRADTVRHYGHLMTAPGERYDYSNLAFGVIDRIIASASGQPVDAYMRAQLFQPLGMRDTSYGPDATRRDDTALPYAPDGSPLPLASMDTPGAGGLYSSAHDLARFMSLHLKRPLAGAARVLDDRHVDEMQRATPASSDGGPGVPKTSRIGWGGADERVRRYDTVTKAGGMPGAATWMVLVPGQDIGVVVLTNVSWTDYQGPSYTIADAILKVLLPDWEDLRSEPWGSEWDQVGSTPDARWQGTWTGRLQTWQGDTPVTLVVPAQGALRLRLGDGNDTAIEDLKVQDTWLRGEAAGTLPTDDARVSGIDRLQLSLKHRGDRINGVAMGFGTGIEGDAMGHWIELRRADP
ncbi:serine hydrolase domain-containing protein [Luteimonas sp. RIT-PG2_3]